MIRVFEASGAIDLTDFAAFLWDNEIPHRITYDGERQVLWVPNASQVEQVRYIFEQWRRGVDLSEVKVRQPLRHRINLLDYPLSISLIALSALITLGIDFGQRYALMHWLTITEFQITRTAILFAPLSETLFSLEWWRLVTPAFMHFNLPHILFNSLWIWVVGRRIERLQGPWALGFIFLFASIISNIAQFWVSGPMFGGMSGVVFAVFAYTWLWDKLAGERYFGFPPAIMIFMAFWLVLGYTGLLSAIGFGSIANTAHLVGLVAGLLAVPVVRRFAKWR
ncbi:rhomboid family intramembrane serine protease [Neptunomonas marina]|uniref:Rhomboid family intramembrane serine protease n=1 Tax=Neptunomonas marina TaxID=1815562 RepID=A0A437QCZ9_9GAMM|nr:rhomboid family intramembrane serine protease [Neptunomonas marina]RVU32418.1 rhomboid family intramembrane serine protease [Neptunomonas marina]